jgi:hypothetical protein
MQCRVQATPCKQKITVYQAIKTISLMVESEITSETSVYFYRTTHIPEDSHLHTRRHENLNTYPCILCPATAHLKSSRAQAVCSPKGDVGARR